MSKDSSPLISSKLNKLNTMNDNSNPLTDQPTNLGTTGSSAKDKNKKSPIKGSKRDVSDGFQISSLE